MTANTLPTHNERIMGADRPVTDTRYFGASGARVNRLNFSDRRKLWCRINAHNTNATYKTQWVRAWVLNRLEEILDQCEPVEPQVEGVMDYTSQQRESAVMIALRNNSPISNGLARAITEGWYSGQTSAMYSFTSTGRIYDKAQLLKEVDDCKRIVSGNPQCYDPYHLWELEKLEEYIRTA